MTRELLLLGQPTREAYAQSLCGFMIWTVAVALLQPGWAPTLLLFGPLILFPLLFDIVAESQAMRRLAFLAFLPTIASYAFDQGMIAGAQALPWLAFTLLFFGYRLLQDIRDRQIVPIVIKGYLIVGASWLVLARLGMRPLDFEHVIVHATAVHFHYAGFVLPMLALHLVRTAPTSRRTVLLAGLLLGVPLVATGITLSAFQIRWVECVAAWLFTAVCVWFAVEQLHFTLTRMHGLPRGLLIMSSLGLSAAMCLAFLYATGIYLGLDWLDIPFMLRWHGPIQVFGFALPGVVAWSIVKQSPLAA